MEMEARGPPLDLGERAPPFFKRDTIFRGGVIVYSLREKLEWRLTRLGEISDYRLRRRFHLAIHGTGTVMTGRLVGVGKRRVTDDIL